MKKWILLSLGIACWTFAAKLLTPLFFKAQVGTNLEFLGLGFGWVFTVGVGGFYVWKGVGEVLKEELEKRGE